MALNFDNSEKFINPYNFVSKTDTVFRAEPKKGNLSGVIHCKMIVKEKIAMPDSEDKENFFNINSEPVIPGSEIRGCIRSVYEAVTNSCFSVVNSNLLSKRIPKPNNSRIPGILMKKNHKWIIYESEYRRGKHKLKEWENGIHCDFHRQWFKCNEKPIINNTFFYIKKSDSGKWLSSGAICNDDDIQKLLDVFDSYIFGIIDLTNDDAPKLKDIILNLKKTLIQMRDSEDSNNMIPVFYQIDKSNHLEYLSPAHTGRVSFKNTLPDLLAEHKPCDGKSKVFCSACRLFGTLGEAAKSPLPSRLRFGDAKLETPKDEVLAEKAEWLPELSSPKITSVEFYSWNDINQKNRFNDANQWNFDSPGVQLRGRKFYFHSKINPEYEPLDENEEKRRIKTRAIETKKDSKTPTSFKFDLFFDKINETELKNLLWVLTLGENDEAGHYLHKIGMGRPVGFGSVKIIVTEVEERVIDFSGRLNYSIFRKNFGSYDLNEASYKNSPDAVRFNSQSMNDLIKISDYNLLQNSSAKVSYPIADNGKNDSNAIAHHQWFTTNRTPRGTFAYPLPKLSSEDLTIPSAKASNRVGKPARNRYNFKRQDSTHHADGYGDRSAKGSEKKPDSVDITPSEEPYDAKIVSEFHDNYGNSFFVISINGASIINGKTCKINKRYAQDKKISDTIKVRYKGLKKNGVPYFYVVQQ